MIQDKQYDYIVCPYFLLNILHNVLFISKYLNYAVNISSYIQVYISGRLQVWKVTSVLSPGASLEEPLRCNFTSVLMEDKSCGHLLGRKGSNRAHFSVLFEGTKGSNWATCMGELEPDNWPANNRWMKIYNISSMARKIWKAGLFLNAQKWLRYIR